MPFVDVRRQDTNAHLAAGQNVLRHLTHIVHNRSHKCREELLRIIVFQIRRLICNHRIAGCMGFVKSVSCEIDHLIINMICSLLINAILNTSLYVFFLIAVHEILAFLLHDRRLLLGHGTAHQIASAHGIARQIANDLHNLFLVDDTAVRRLQNRF